MDTSWENQNGGQKIVDDDRGGTYKVSTMTKEKSFIEKYVGIRYSLRYIGVFCLTEEREEHLLVGFPKKNHCLMPLEWSIIYQTFF